MTPARRLLVTAGLACAALAAPATAGAVPVVIDSAPLNVFLGGSGNLQVRFDGADSGEFFSPGSDEANAGFQLSLDPSSQGSAIHISSGGFTAEGAGPVTGSGSPADPFRQVTQFGATNAAGSPVRIVQTATYVAGSLGFDLTWQITNLGSSSTVVRPGLYADLYVSGSDSGVGFFEAGPPAVVGGVNQEAGSSGGIVQISPWLRFEEGQYSTVNSHMAELPGPGLTNSVSSLLEDNGVGVQLSESTLAPGASATYSSGWRFSRFEGLSVDPAESARPVGELHTVKVRAQGNAGVPASGVPIRYSISGANPTGAEAVVVTGADGAAEISWRGTNAGTDTLDITADLNGNGAADGNEPRRSATVTFLAPEVGRTTVVEPVRGEVFVRLPPGASAAAYGLDAKPSQSAPKGFLPLTGAATLPVRTIVNTNKGEIRLKAAVSPSSRRTAAANFFSGTFQIIQKRARRPVTEMVLKGGSFRGCPRTRRAKGSVDAEDSRRRTSRSRVRRLWGNGRGRFRTRGRYSSATVRGTKWLVEDRCGGTLTRLPRRPRSSRVDVRDFGRRKTIRLRAGRSYLALPRAARARK